MESKGSFLYHEVPSTAFYPELHNHTSFTFFSVALRPNAGHGLLILDVSRSHTTTHHSR